MHAGPNSALLHLTANRFRESIHCCHWSHKDNNNKDGSSLTSRENSFLNASSWIHRQGEEINGKRYFAWIDWCRSMQLSEHRPCEPVRSVTANWAKSIPDPAPVKWMDHILSWCEMTRKVSELCSFIPAKDLADRCPRLMWLKCPIKYDHRNNAAH